MATCNGLSQSGAFVTGMMNSIECHAQTIGDGAYGMFLSQNQSSALIITGALTIFVALFGYRLMLGGALTLRETVVSFVKIGMILTLASSWISYRTLVYNVVMHEPANLVSKIGGYSKLPGANSNLDKWLQVVDNRIVDFSFLGPGNYEPSALQKSFPTPKGANSLNAAAGFWDPLHEESLILKARSIFLISSIGAFAIVRLIAGLFVALGPIFIAFMFFESTIGLFVGWIRVLVATIIGAFATSIILGVELSIIYPWLQNILNSRVASQSVSTAPTELLVIVSVFALAVLGSLIASVAFSTGFKLPNAVLKEFRKSVSNTSELIKHIGLPSSQSTNKNNYVNISRAQMIANAINNSDHRFNETNRQMHSKNNLVNSSQRNSSSNIISSLNSHLGRQASRQSRNLRTSLSANRRENIV